MAYRSHGPDLKTTSSRPDHHPATPAAANLHRRAEGRVIIHRTRKEERWSVTIRPSETTLLIGDSNMRLATMIPTSWTSHVFPGAKSRDVVDILRSLDVRHGDQLRRVIVQVAINDRDDPVPTDYIAEAARICKSLRLQLIYVGVPLPTDAPSRVANSVREFNAATQSEVRTLFISPVPSSQVVISRGDRHGIHHTVDTVQAVVRSIIQFIDREPRDYQD